MVNFQHKEAYGYEDLLEIMAILRAPGGCPRDAEQTHRSIRRDMLEETCEAAEAIDRDDMSALCEELGDMLLQVVFHARIEEDTLDWTTKSITVTAYAETKAHSRLINKYIEEHNLKCKRMIQGA